VADKHPIGNEPERPKRAKLTPEESRKRVQEFAKRKESLLAALRKGKN
jgi:hypothetical protein